MKTGIELITEERREQIEKHGRSIKRDVKENCLGQLSLGAFLLLSIDHDGLPGLPPAVHPPCWDYSIWNRMTEKSYKERLIIAGALIAAEIDRLNFDTKQQPG